MVNPLVIYKLQLTESAEGPFPFHRQRDADADAVNTVVLIEFVISASHSLIRTGS